MYFLFVMDVGVLRYKITENFIFFAYLHGIDTVGNNFMDVFSVVNTSLLLHDLAVNSRQ